MLVTVLAPDYHYSQMGLVTSRFPGTYQKTGTLKPHCAHALYPSHPQPLHVLNSTVLWQV